MIDNNNVIVGYVSNDVAKKWGLESQKGKTIIQGSKWEQHARNHKREFKCIKNYYEAIKSVPLIIQNPDYVFYNEEEKGLEYYKMLSEGVTLVVSVTGKRDLYTATLYPSSVTKRDNRKNKELEILESDILKKYAYSGEYTGNIK